MRTRLAGLLAAGIAALLPLAAAAQERIALVIGNAAYRNSPLANPVNDATDVATALRALGFHVIARNNATQAEMRGAVRDFGNRLRRAQAGLFYFAGHGLQIAGNNYIVPVNADIRSEADAEDQSINMAYVLRTMEESQVKVSLVVLDACRNNPYARSFRSAASGLAQMNAATGSLIAFATAPGAVAADGTGRNGIYTKHLLESLRHPDTDVLKVFQRTRAGVVAETGGIQTPWESTSLVGDFYFRGRPAPAAAPAAAAPAGTVSAAEDRVFWESVKDSRNPAELQAYLDQFPNGVYAPLARNRLAAARPAAAAAAAAAAAESGPRSVAESVARMNTLLGAMAPRPVGQKQTAAGLVYGEVYAADNEGLRYRTWRCASSLIKGCEPQYLEGGVIPFRGMRVELKSDEHCNSGPTVILFGKRCQSEQVLRVGGGNAFSESGWDVVARGFDSASQAVAKEMHELLQRSAH